MTETPETSPVPEAAAPAYVEPKRPEEMSPEELVARIRLLEDTLLPFAKISVAMSNARLVLAASDRGTEPGGGHFVNGVHRTQMVCSEAFFYRAINSVGRARTEAAMMHDAHMTATLTKACEESRKMLDAGFRTDH